MFVDRLNRNWLLASLVSWLITGPGSATAQDFRLTRPFAFAGVELELDVTPDGSGPMNMGTDEIDDPSIDFAAFSHVTTFPGSNGLGEGAAYQDQFGINAVFVDSNGALDDAISFFGTATTNYQIRILTASAQSGLIPFQFVINGGELRVNNFAQFNPSMPDDGAAVVAEIRINDDHWRFSAVLTKDETAGAPMVIEDEVGNLDEFGLNIFPALATVMDGDDAVVTIPQITGEVLLDGSVFDFPGAIFSYRMGAHVTLRDSVGAGGLAGITDPFALGTPDDASDDLGDPFNPLGVQFFLNDQPLSSYSFVPEPGSGVLSALGALVGLVGRRRRSVHW